MKLTHVAVAAALLLTACASKTPNVKEPADPTADQLHFVARQNAIDEMMANFRRVRFAFDSASITEDTADALAANVGIMSRFEEIKLEIEGHCDELGSTEYNLALGQRRADAMRKYMVTAGVHPSRIATVSYGEERPLDSGTGEESWSQNRRAEFHVRVAPPGVHGSEEDGPIAQTDSDEEE